MSLRLAPVARILGQLHVPATVTGIYAPVCLYAWRGPWPGGHTPAGSAGSGYTGGMCGPGACTR